MVLVGGASARRVSCRVAPEGEPAACGFRVRCLLAVKFIVIVTSQSRLPTSPSLNSPADLILSSAAATRPDAVRSTANFALSKHSKLLLSAMETTRSLLGRAEFRCAADDDAHSTGAGSGVPPRIWISPRSRVWTDFDGHAERHSDLVGGCTC